MKQSLNKQSSIRKIVRPIRQSWDSVMIRDLRRIVDLLLRPRTAIIMCFIILVAGMTLRLAEVHLIGRNAAPSIVYYYGSDDAAQADIMYARQHGATGKANTGPDSWFLKFPVYEFTNNLPVSPNIRLFLNAWIPLEIGACLLLTAYIVFTRRLQLSLRRFSLSLYSVTLLLVAMPAIAFITFGTANSRNIELGMVTLATALIFADELDARLFATRQWLKYSLLIVGTGLVCADDPYFMYVFIAPLAMLTIVLYFFGARVKGLLAAGLVAFGGGVAGLVFRKVAIIAFSLGTVQQPTLTTSADGFLSNWRYLLNYGPNLFGIFPWSRQYGAPSNILSVVYGLIGVLSIIGIVWSFRRQSHHRYPVLVAGLLLASPLVLTITTLVNPLDLMVTRYIILCVPLLLFGVPLFYAFSKSRRQVLSMALAVVCLVVLVLGQTSKQLITHIGSGDTNRNYISMVGAIQKQHITKGYGNYQFANIGSFLSKHETTILPTICLGYPQQTVLKFYDVLVQTSLLYQKTSKSFFLYSPDDTINCSPAYLTSQLGSPAKIVPVLRSNTENVDMAIYNYDIGTKLSIQKAGA